MGSAQSRWVLKFGPIVPRKLGANGSLLTRRWREMDSNHRSLSQGSQFTLRKVNCARIDGRPKKNLAGTDGSNPSPSSDESIANPTFADASHRISHAE